MWGPSHGPAFGGIQTIRVLYDAAGNPIRVQVHGNIEGRFSLTGSPLRENERRQIFIDLVEGAETAGGLVFRVFLSGGGTVIADVGRLVFDAEGNVISRQVPTRPCMATSPPSAPHSTKLGLSAESIDVPSACRATRVPYRRVNHGIERTTRVTAMSPLTWSPNALAA